MVAGGRKQQLLMKSMGFSVEMVAGFSKKDDPRKNRRFFYDDIDSEVAYHLVVA